MNETNVVQEQKDSPMDGLFREDLFGPLRPHNLMQCPYCGRALVCQWIAGMDPCLYESLPSRNQIKVQVAYIPADVPIYSFNATDVLARYAGQKKDPPEPTGEAGCPKAERMG